MLSVSNLEKHIGPRILFAGATFYLNKGQRYGLVGANGCGKSTFLKMLAGEEELSGGSLALNKGARIALLRQDQFAADDETILHVAMKGQKQIYDALKALGRLKGLEQAALLSPELAASHEETLLRLDGYTLDIKAAQILDGLGIAGEKHLMPLSALSGGFKWRVLLAQVLISKPDVMLLDEPTNHLDIVSIRWLEKFLQSFEGCALVISHDRRFLENVCTDILDVDYDTITLYAGSYAAFEAQKQLRREQLEAEIAGQEREIAHKQAFVERFKAKASKARQAQSRIKQIEKIEIKPLPKSSRRYLSLNFVQKRSSGKEVLDVHNLSKSFGDKKVISNLSFLIQRGQKVGVIGPNGVGKSTLLKIAMDDGVAADAGIFKWGFETQLGYFAQDHEQAVRKANMSIEDWLWQYCSGESKGFVRSYLGRVLFSGDDADKKVSQLSGGEVARLVLAKLMLLSPNVLVLDEPTNHLDMEAVESLIKALKAYEGTLIFVSHDRFFVSELATRIIELKPNGFEDFAGTFGEYLQKCGDDHLDAAVAIRLKKQGDAPIQKDSVAAKDSYQASKEQRAERRKLESQRDKILSEIALLEKRQSELDGIFAEAAFYLSTSHDKQQALLEEKRLVEKSLQEKTQAWEALEEVLA